MTTLTDTTLLRTEVPIASGATAWLRATRAELRRLLRPGFAGIIAILVAAFAMMATTVTFAGEFDGPSLNQVAVDLDSARGLIAGLGNLTSLLGIVMLAAWAAATASDFGTGWIRVMVQAEPRRWALLAGKLTALAILTLGVTLLATMVSVAAAPAVAQGAGVSTDAWFTDAPATILSGWANLTLAVLAWGVIGMAIAMVTRSAVAAIAGGIGYLIVFEGLLGQLAPDATTWLPGTVLNTLSAGGSPDLAWGSALGLGVGYVVAGILVSAVAFIRRDITA
jgi:hypothetical protein